ncbi:unnamed protein product, partial [Hydatigera taeniaeformis]|uniref:ribose-5-phosphate isomerase n=1 Tax=Hydatigena taeniaeformis TaxID=6205 RepID=A0A0R3XDG6_HYDTA
MLRRGAVGRCAFLASSRMRFGSVKRTSARMANVDVGKKCAAFEAVDEWLKLDVAFDGVDEITPDFLSIKGGGGCLVQEKIVDANAKYFIAIADE